MLWRREQGWMSQNCEQITFCTYSSGYHLFHSQLRWIDKLATSSGSIAQELTSLPILSRQWAIYCGGASVWKRSWRNHPFVEWCSIKIATINKFDNLFGMLVRTKRRLSGDLQQTISQIRGKKGDITHQEHLLPILWHTAPFNQSLLFLGVDSGAQ